MSVLASNSMKDRVLTKLRQLAKHTHLKLTNSGNSAILLSLISAKSAGKTRILIPDQGGWITFKTFPPLLGLKVTELRTSQGIMEIEDLQNKADEHSAVLFTSLAGYMAPQPLKQIAEICHQRRCLLVEDASGGIGFDSLCDGAYSDIIVASFGKWKPVNLGYGGFISVKDKRHLNLDPELILMTRFHDQFHELLLRKLDQLPTRLQYLTQECDTVKSQLSAYDIIHTDSQGLVVAVRFSSIPEKEKIIKYCSEHDYPYTICPRYIRTLEHAVCIEIKRLDQPAPR